MRARPNPFSTECIHFSTDPGLTLEELSEKTQRSEPLRRLLGCSVGGKNVARRLWRHVRVKPGVVVLFHPLPARSNENALAGQIAGALLVLAGTVLIATGVGAPVGAGLIIAGTALSTASSFLLTPKPVEADGAVAGRPSYAITNTQNEARPLAPVSELFGTFRFAPRHAAFPYTETSGGETYFRAIFHLTIGMCTNPIIQIGETSINNFSEVETNFYRGWHTDDINDQGTWSAASGSFPANPVFGDHYTVSSAGTVAGTYFSAGQTITFNRLYQPGTAAAWDVDQFKSPKIFTDDVYSEEFQAQLSPSWTERTTAQQTDEFVIVGQFIGGLINYSSKGKARSYSVTFEVQWSPVGESNWTTTSFSISGRQTTPLLFSKRFKVDKAAATNGQFDVRFRRTSSQQPSGSRTTDAVYYLGLQSYSRKGNVVPIGGRAFLEMRIRASDQLSGPLNQVLVTATRIARDWNGAEWLIRPCNSPVAAVRAVYQDRFASSEAQIPDSELDLTRFQQWGDFCSENGLECNGYCEDQKPVTQRIADIMATGRAVPDWRTSNGYSVIWDGPKTAPAQILSPRNSRGFTSTFSYPVLPHAVRLSFKDQDRNYETNEDIVVFADGYNDGNAVDYERMEFQFVTSADQAMRAARHALADRWFRREVFERQIGINHLVSERGDRIDLQHDCIGVGLGGGRVKSVTNNGAGGTVDTITLDAVFDLEDETDYAAEVQLSGGGVVSYGLTTTEGQTDTFTLSLPSSTTVPAVGDHVVIGEADNATFPAIIAFIKPGPDETAVLTCIPYDDDIYTWDQSLPDYTPRTAKPRQLTAPQVLAVRSNIDVMVETPSGGLEGRVVFTLGAPDERDVTLTILQKLSGTDQPFAVSAIVSRTTTIAAISGIIDGETYDFRLYYSRDGYYDSAPALVSGHRVIGGEEPPQALQNLSLVPIGQNVILTWDEPVDRDVLLGGWIEFRHVASTGGGTWQTSQPIGRGPVSGASTHTWLPAIPGTYLARVFDRTNIPSDDISSVVLDKDHDHLDYSPYLEVAEHPTFSGQKTNAKVVGSSLVLETGDFDSVLDTDLLISWDEAGLEVVVATASYVFAAGIDTGEVAKYRVTRHIIGSAYDENDRIDLWGSIDDRESMDGAVAAPADVTSLLRWTDDDPAGSPTWSAWQKFEVATLRARAFEFAVAIANDLAEYQCRIDELSAKVEKLI